MNKDTWMRPPNSEVKIEVQPQPTDSAADAREIGLRLLARDQDIAGELVARITEQVPGYGTLSAGTLEDVMRLALRNTQTLARALTSGRPVSESQLDYVAEHVKDRVRQGLTLDRVLHAYREGIIVQWERCMAEVANLGLSRESAVEISRTLYTIGDRLTTHAAAAYVREELRIQGHGQQAARDLMELLILGEALPMWDRHPAAPTMDPQGAWLVAVGRIRAGNDPGSDLDTAVGAVKDLLASPRSTPMVTTRQRAIVAVLPYDSQGSVTLSLTVARNRLMADTGVDLVFGVSLSCDGFSGIRLGYEEASLAVSNASETRPVVSLHDMPALHYALNSASRRAQANIANRGARLAALGPVGLGTMRSSLLAFADADLNVTKAAGALHVHPNTLRYRLNRVRLTTGHDPLSFADLVELICILEAMELPAH
jgi:hypothetical protein